MNALPVDTPQLIAVAAAMGWASGLRLYAVVFLTGLAGALGWIALPVGLQPLSHPLALGVSGVMLAVEFFADKIPALDSLWDTLHTLVRIPGGAALAAAAVGADSATSTALAAILGGALAATSHVAKTTTRAAVNTLPEPLSNIGLSLAGDLAVPASLWLAWQHSTVFWVFLVVAVVLMLWLSMRLFKFLRSIWQRARGWFAPASQRS